MVEIHRVELQRGRLGGEVLPADGVGNLGLAVGNANDVAQRWQRQLTQS